MFISILIGLLIQSAVLAQGGGFEAYLPLIGKGANGTMHLLDTHYHYTNPNNGYLFFVGELENQTPVYINRVGYGIKIWKGGSEYSLYGPLFYKYLPPYEKACFAISFNNFAAIDRYEFITPFSSQVAEVESVPVNVATVGSELKPNGDYEVTGVLENEFSHDLEGVFLQATLYDSEGTVKGCVTTEIESIVADDTHTFVLLFDTRENYSDVTTYRVIAYGIEAQ